MSTACKNKKNKFRMFQFFMIVALGTALISSCSKQKGDEVNPDGSTTISVNIGGVRQATTASPKTKGGTKIAATANNKLKPHDRILTNGDMKMSFTSFEEDNLSFGGNTTYPTIKKVKIASTNAQRNSLSINPLAIAETVPMPIGVKYWLVLRNQATQRFEYSLQAVSGTELTLDIVKNERYDWYAYSYNNTDDIPPLDPNNPQIQTYTDKPLLYASGTVRRISPGNEPLKIEFEHQLKQIKVQIDTRGIFGDIISHGAEFMESNYIKTGKFNVLGGTFTNLTTVPTTNLTFEDLVQGSSRAKITSFYSSDLTVNSYAVKFTALTVALPDGTNSDLLQSFPGGREEIFTFSQDSKGKIHYAQIDIWRNITEKRVVHFEPDPDYSYTASQTDRPSGAFFRNTTNFGPNVSSHMRIQPLHHEVRLRPSAGDIYERLEGRNTLRTDPDILIISAYHSYNSSDYGALVRYLERGGAVFLMTSNDGNQALQDHFFSDIFPNSPQLSTTQADEMGAIYRLKDIDPNILSWPFDDAREKYWGSHSRGTLYIDNLSAADLADIVVYSNGSVNYANHRLNSISMFRHKKLNLFFVGNNGFAASRVQTLDGEGPYAGDDPFTINSDSYPVPRLHYGERSETGAIEIKSVAGWKVHNSTLFANTISWLIMQSHLNGANTP